MTLHNGGLILLDAIFMLEADFSRANSDIAGENAMSVYKAVKH